MIVRRVADATRLARELGWKLAIMLAYDMVVTLLFVVGHVPKIGLESLPLPLLGSALALVITIRNNAAYSRWWEARTLWGAVVNGSRSFGRGLLVFSTDRFFVSTLVRHQIAFAQALRCHLRRQPAWEACAGMLAPETIERLRPSPNVPLAIQVEMGRIIGAAHQANALDSVSAAALNTTLSDLANAQGGLERIKNTPLARQYNQYPQAFTFVYCALLPLGLVQDLGFFTPLGSTVIGFMFLALDQIGRDLEDPFENTVHDVPMTAISRTIEIDLRALLGETDLPPAIVPRQGVLD